MHNTHTSISLKPFNVLFLCTHNAARSILSEAILNHLGQGGICAYSAGSQPKPNQQPNPYALRALTQAHISTQGLSSKSWDVFSNTYQANPPIMDLVITVCDNAAGETCPYWAGSPLKAHWGYSDPSATIGDDATVLAAFTHTLELIQTRLKQLIVLINDYQKKNNQNNHTDNHSIVLNHLEKAISDLATA